MSATRTLTAVGSMLLALVLASCSANGQEQREPTGVQDEDADIGPTDSAVDGTDNGTDGVNIRSPLDPEFGEKARENETDEEDTPAVAVPLVVVGLAALLAAARRLEH